MNFLRTLTAIGVLATIGCSTPSAPNTPTPAATVQSTAVATPEIDREITQVDLIELLFDNGDTRDKVEVSGLRVQVTNQKSDFFRDDFFVTTEVLKEIGEARGFDVAVDESAKTLRVGEIEYEFAPVPPLGRGVGGSIASSGMDQVERLVHEDQAYFRFSSIYRGLRSNGISKTDNGYVIAVPK